MDAEGPADLGSIERFFDSAEFTLSELSESNGSARNDKRERARMDPRRSRMAKKLNDEVARPRAEEQEWEQDRVRKANSPVSQVVSNPGLR